MEACKAILVTGASSGIGRCVTERLSRDGYFVYAGARKKSDLQDLEELRNVQPIRLDVNNHNEISAALATVRTAGRGLYGIVNNAGVATFGPIVNGNEKEFELVMMANVFGPYFVTKSFAPLVVEEKGRIVMMGSISGILANVNVGAYSMSKHAVEAFTDSLGAELAPLGVQVSVIEPGNLNTRIAANALERLGQDHPFPDLSKCVGPEDVALAVSLALFERTPKRRYLVVQEEIEARTTIEKQILQLVQLNEDHPYTYQRRDLVEMLDAALVRSRSAPAVL